MTDDFLAGRYDNLRRDSVHELYPDCRGRQQTRYGFPTYSIQLQSFACGPLAEYVSLASGGGAVLTSNFPHTKKLEEPQEISPAAASRAIEAIASGRVPRIERRRVSRACYRTQAWLQPVDETGALRCPVVFSRDLDGFGMGFIAHHDLSPLDLAMLCLPAGNGQPVRIKCHIRRSREFASGWFEGAVEFTVPQPQLAVVRA
jgi:hypothetical protein